MLHLKGITKNYVVGEEQIRALRGINLVFRDSEFVSILGQSGCGKTTLLNIIGGLDQYTTGDLLIDGKSTQQFASSDWDGYRNSSVGFVFQSYNLISHLSVLENVAMSLSLSGVSAREKNARAKKVLEEVGLGQYLKKKPNQLSGGQMQRVAIARALVNNPKILLADEPTGALDSETSVAIMELIKKVSKDRLVIMVTHNPDLAEAYSDRIINMFDGKIVDDSNSAEESEHEGSAKLETKKTSMSYEASLRSSFKNLWSKKARTILTTIAGSIGIIGVALVLAMGNGMTAYIDAMQGDQLSGFPITISETNNIRVSSSENVSTIVKEEFTAEDVFYPTASGGDSYTTHTNLFTDEFLTYMSNMDEDLYNAISYTSNVSINTVLNSGSAYSELELSSYLSELPDSQDFIETQYDILFGSYPTSYNQMVLVVDESNNVSADMLALLGISAGDTMKAEDLMGITFVVAPNDAYYECVNGLYVQNTNYDSVYNNEQSISMEVVGILRIKETSSTEFLSTGLMYTTDLTDKVLELNATSAIVEAQKADTTTSVLTGLTFASDSDYTKLMGQLGGISTPSGMSIYPASYDANDEIKAYIDAYNEDKSSEEQIYYVDWAETITSAMSSIVDTTTMILTGFAAISLVVSSLMIGIITYISVVERTKEIGIMRAIGARKKDISRIFNAEALIIGFSAGLFGVLFSAILCLPISSVLGLIVDGGFDIFMTFGECVLLVAISTMLTFIAGLIPAKIASKKDPIVALRTE